MSDVTENSAGAPEGGEPQPGLRLAAPMSRKPVVSSRMAVRIWSGFVLTLCLMMLGMGLYLKPDPRGTGTHQQLGLPPCGWYETWGFPCMTCGCTTAVSHFSHGHFIASFVTQPFGFCVGLVGAILVPLTMIGVATGKWKGPSMFIMGWYWVYWVWGGVVILLGAWIYKIIMVKNGHPV